MFMIPFDVVFCVTYIAILDILDHTSNIFPTGTVKYSLIIDRAVLDIQLMEIKYVNAQILPPLGF